jgi:predicted peptidase
MHRPFFLLLAATMTLVSAADGAAPAYTKHPIGSTKAPYGFIEHLPAGLVLNDKSTTYPLVFFMHGHGELGDSNNDLPKLAQHGPFKHLVANDAIGKLIDENKAIVIAPQGLKSDNWFKGELLVATLKYVLENYPVDPQRIYVTGLSMGGGGTWTVASAMPDRVAAAMPVCGAGKIANADKLRGIPLWAFHAVDDPTVKFPVSTQAWFDAIFADLGVKRDGGVMGGLDIAGKTWTGTLVGGKEWAWKEGTAPSGTLESASVSLTVYPNGGHDSWSRTYANAEVWKWLFAQRKAK